MVGSEDDEMDLDGAERECDSGYEGGDESEGEGSETSSHTLGRSETSSRTLGRSEDEDCEMDDDEDEEMQDEEEGESDDEGDVFA